MTQDVRLQLGHRMYVYSYDTGRTFTAMTLYVVYGYGTRRTFTAMTLDVVYSYDTGRCLQLWHKTSFTAMAQDVRLQL